MRPKWITKIRKLLSLCISVGLLIVALLVACSPNVQIQAPLASHYTISGTVARDQLFTQRLAPTLTFQLIPMQGGWEIWVGDPTFSTGPESNFAMPVTPPFAAVNTRHLQGWHFRNSDNSGPNQAGDKNVNAPQEVRPFCFVANRPDFQRALDALSAGLPALATATETLPLHSGTLTITHATLGNLVTGQNAWFEQMDFTVNLNLDQPCSLFS